MRKRSKARAIALQYLYAVDLHKEEKSIPLDYFIQHFSIMPAVHEFAEMIIKGVLAHQEYIDGLIMKYAQNWKIHRIAVVDRTVLRMAIFEILYCDDIPDVVSINEAVDLAKRYSTEESGKFVNGILDRVREQMHPGKI